MANVARVRPDIGFPVDHVLGVTFFAGSLTHACERAAQGGLLTAPSGPGLAYDLLREPCYRQALEASDVVLTDSAFMVLLWRLRSGRRLPRNSGLAFLRQWVNRDIMRRAGAVFWVMPSVADVERAMEWLRERGYPVSSDQFYVAPHYGPGSLSDPVLAQLIELRAPQVVYVGIGGGVQERLGHYLRDALSYTPTILCLGAALAFLTGTQVAIPRFADRWGLGWLWRIGSNPRRYLPRYVRATRLAWLILRFGRGAPPLRPSVQEVVDGRAP